jgi:thymidylate synthase
MARTIADAKYAHLLESILKEGQYVNGRNSSVLRLAMPSTMTFTEFPLITARKTAVGMALKEWEWFCSGEPDCPVELAPWWKNQLTGMIYLDGYPQQMRQQATNVRGTGSFDQLKYLLESLITLPFSRRHVISLWNTGDMSEIAQTNGCDKTPSTCHSTVIQCFVNQDNTLDMFSYQRSADVILGLPHNLVQTWAFLKYLAAHTNMTVGKLKYQLGDAHIYQADGHMETAYEIVRGMRDCTAFASPYLAYFANAEVNNNDVPVFDAGRFQVTDTEDVSPPIVTIKPKLVD